MFFSNIRNSIKSRLGTKSILASILLISAISIILSTFFVSRQKKVLMDELHKRALSLTNSLAYNSQIPLMAQDEETILNFISGMKQEEDITDAFITWNTKWIRFHSDTTMVGELAIAPKDIDIDIVRGGWYSSDKKNIKRIVSPVLGFPKRPAEMDEILLSAPEEEDKRDTYIGYTGRTGFPSFANNKEISFNYRRYTNSDLHSIDIETRAISRILINGRHGRYSNDGRYMVFLDFSKETQEKSFFDNSLAEIKYLNKDTNEIRFIHKSDLIHSIPHFSHDNKYIYTSYTRPRSTEREEKETLPPAYIYRIPVEGGNKEQLTTHEGMHFYPVSSPDGKWILYTDYYDGVIWAYDIETKKSIKLFPDVEAKQLNGDFSPDGSKICYQQVINGKLQVFTADFPPKESADNNITQLTFDDAGHGSWIDWSPDGKWITYGMDADIYIISPEGGEPINLTYFTPVLGYAVLDVSLENVNREIAAAIWQAVVITLIMIGAGSLGVVFLVRSISAPIHTLAESAKAVGREDLDKTVEIDRTDEIGVLAGAFNDMIGRLKISREKIESWNRELEEKVTERTAELEKSHKELEKAYKELETLDKTKDDFLSLVSHELRTPLSSVLLYSEMLLDGLADNEETRNEFLTTIVDNCKRLTRLINDVLDLSKIEAGRMPFNIEDLNIRNLVEETHSGVRPALESHGINFEYEKVDKETMLRGDRDKIVQVLTNIISNAVKFTPDGGTITVSLNKNDRMGEIAIKDTGKGIKKEDIPKVFDRFTQIESIDHHSGGTGLGMTISKSIIERLGGEIRIESELNKGTTVFLTLPRTQ